MTNNIYTYPKYYELLFGDRDFKAEAEFLMRLVSKFSDIKVKNVLDIACGSDPHLSELSKRGFNVAGLDISKEMLDELKKRFKGSDKLIGVYKEDMSSFRLERKFDMCICMVNSLEILNKNEKFISHFESAADCLNSGGLYIIELDSPSSILSNPKPGKGVKEYKKNINREGIIIDVIYRRYPFDIENSLERNELIMKVNDNGRQFTIIDDSPVRRLTPQEIDLFIRLNGKFELVKILGGFDLRSSVNDKGSKKMVVVLKRK